MPLTEVNIRSTYVFQEVTVFSLTCHLCYEKKDNLWHWKKKRNVPGFVWIKKSPSVILRGPSKESFTQCCGSVKELTTKSQWLSRGRPFKEFCCQLSFCLLLSKQTFSKWSNVLVWFSPLFSDSEWFILPIANECMFRFQHLIILYYCYRGVFFFFSFVLLCYDSLLKHGKDSGNISCLLNSHAALIDFCLDSHE